MIAQNITFEKTIKYANLKERFLYHNQSGGTMVSVEITGIKEFMNKLLNSEAFDSFYLEEAVIATFNTFIIDGHLVKSDTEELHDNTDPSPIYSQTTGQGTGQTAPLFSTWKQLRPIIFSLIKGDRVPHSMKLTLHAGSNYMHRLKNRPEAAAYADAIKALAVNIRYENGKLKCVTGTSYQTFIMDKTIDNIWDSDFISSLAAMGIKFIIQ